MTEFTPPGHIFLPDALRDAVSCWFGERIKEAVQASKTEHGTEPPSTGDPVHDGIRSGEGWKYKSFEALEPMLQETLNRLRGALFDRRLVSCYFSPSGPVEVPSFYWASSTAQGAIQTGEYSSFVGGPTEKLFVSAEALKQFLQEGREQSGRKASTKNKPGRTKGTGYRRADELLVAEMKQLVDSGQAPSATKAAEMIADRAQGLSKESKVRRLVKVYHSMHPRKTAG
jgi:hypothetical protein